MATGNISIVPDLNPLLETDPLTIKTTTVELSLEDAIKALKDYSPSEYNDSKWLITVAQKQKNSPSYENKLSFEGFPCDDRVDMTKRWAIQMLLMRQSLSQIRQKIYRVRQFIENTSNHENKYFSDYSEKDIVDFYHYVFENEQTLQNQLEKWLFLKQFMSDIGCGEQALMMEKITVPLHHKKKRHDEKYIPDEIAKRMDYIFKTDETIPLPYRCIYWTLRLLINRINEVCSMQENCLKQVTEDTYVLTLPTFKQSGPYAVPQLRLVEIKYEGIGSYLIDLLKEQIEYAKEHHDPDAEVNFLFRSPCYMYIQKSGKYSIWGTEIHSLNRMNVSNFFKKFCKGHDLTDENGDPYNITTHQFRHNATSDRLNSGIFRAIDIITLTGHHNTAMVEQSYTHTTPKQLAEKVHNIEHGDVNTPAPVIFHGRVINGVNTDKRLEQIAARPFAKRIHNLGICSDIRGCSKDRFQCLKCEYLVPDVADLDYYIHEKEDWEQKLEKARNLGMDYFAENCEYNLELFRHIIDRILSAITNKE